jgi:hypothetical protein
MGERMSNENYGPLSFYIGKWKSEKWTGENRAPDPDRNVENTKFKQEMSFEPIGDVNNHEQKLFALRYCTKAWEEGDEEDPFHEEVGYFIWDKENKQVLKSFIVPRGISVNAGGTTTLGSKEFTVSADVGSETYGISSNLFLNEEFKSIRYDITFKQLDENTFSYDEDTQIKIKGQDELFHHTEKNILRRVL